MSTLQTLESGSRHDLRVGKSPDAPDESLFKDDSRRRLWLLPLLRDFFPLRRARRACRAVRTPGCLLRCTYCHNPDTWHLKDGTYVSAQQVLDRLAGFASAVKALDGGLTISGGEPMVQLAFTKRIFAGAKKMGLHTAIETSGFLGDRADDSYLSVVDLVPARHQKLKSRHLSQGHRPRSCADAAVCRAPCLDRQAGVGTVHARARPDRRSRECRRHCQICRADEERRMGGGSAFPSNGCLQMEGNEPRIQMRRYAPCTT